MAEPPKKLELQVKFPGRTPNINLLAENQYHYYECEFYASTHITT